jgi:hypothetical protein
MKTRVLVLGKAKIFVKERISETMIFINAVAARFSYSLSCANRIVVQISCCGSSISTFSSVSPSKPNNQSEFDNHSMFINPTRLGFWESVCLKKFFGSAERPISGSYRSASRVVVLFEMLRICSKKGDVNTMVG